MASLRTTRGFNKNRYNKVKAIKAFRQLSSLGLKEAKDGVESAAIGIPYEFQLNNLSSTVDREGEALTSLTEEGFTIGSVSPQIEVILEATKQSAIMASKAGDSELARILLGVLIEFDTIEKRREDERYADYEAAANRRHIAKEREIEREKMQHEREMRHEEQNQMRNMENIAMMTDDGEA